VSIKEIKVNYKWKINLYPLFKIDCLKVKAFTKQYITTLSFFFNLIWIELNFSAELVTLKIGIENFYFMIGGGSNEQ
tara:strand:- start:1764 stop:1994 length:231 start_codon:yes stop_codon:yes gene_type:complete